MDSKEKEGNKRKGNKQEMKETKEQKVADKVPSDIYVYWLQV